MSLLYAWPSQATTSGSTVQARGGPGGGTCKHMTFGCSTTHSSLRRPGHTARAPVNIKPWHKQPSVSARAKIYFHFKKSPEINK